MKLYSIYDCKSETYTAPTLNPARGQAIRSFSDAINGKGVDSASNVLSSHPEDFTLFELGEYDINTGEITVYDTKKAIANGVDLLINE